MKMTKLAIVITVLLSILDVSSAIAAGIYDGNLSLASQAEVDSFNHTEITGSLTITGDDIQDLSPLSVLTSVGEYLSISHNVALEVVDGFENLTHLGWGLYVYGNPVLVSFAGFNKLPATGDNIDFWYNDSLVSVSGFESLQTAGWSLEFGGNPVLTSIPNFDSLQTIASSLFILDNNSLPGITGFNALQYVDWSFDIVGNISLNNLCGFYDYFSGNNPYSGGGSFNISQNHPDLPEPTTIQDILDAGPCQSSPVQQITDLIAEIEVMGLTKRVTNNLLRSLTKAQKSLESGRPDRAVSQLEDLINDIAYLASRGNIDSNTADELTVAVQAIIDTINS
ncbi:MAG: hypothetical protein R3297_08435 [Desulfobulbales bacterium]|nr:hypothetical protein [Desulfobulbales bacterium]